MELNMMIWHSYVTRVRSSMYNCGMKRERWCVMTAVIHVGMSPRRRLATNHACSPNEVSLAT